MQTNVMQTKETINVYTTMGNMYKGYDLVYAAIKQIVCPLDIVASSYSTTDWLDYFMALFVCNIQMDANS